MHSLTFVIFIFAAVIIEICFSQSNCDSRSDIGTIGEKRRLSREKKVEKCWIIKVPAQKYAKIELTKLSIDRTTSTSVYIKIGDRTIRPPLQSEFKHVGEKDTTVTFYAENTRNANEVTAEFELNYQVESLACDQSDAFRCSETECVPKSKRCDGVRDCANGADEQGCDPLKEIRDIAVKNLLEMMYVSGGWGPQTPDAVIAMYLATGTNFRDKLEEKLIAKELELHVCRNSGDMTTNDFFKALPQFINALLAIGVDSTTEPTTTLIQALKTKQDDPIDKAARFLALCNAGEKLIGDITAIMNSFPTGPIDQQYYAAMTINCMDRQLYEDPEDRNKVNAAFRNLKTAIRPLKNRQRRDGSFSGNLIESAMIVQAIMASNTTALRDWDYKGAIDYLKNEMNKTSVEFEPLVLTLPVLGQKTLADIGDHERYRKEAVLRKKEARKGIFFNFREKNIFSKIAEVKKNKMASPVLQIARSKVKDLINLRET